ncbi:YjgN family protein [Marinobacter fonticola]|uniref:YjgN family protein n=1 Tax=Marinobacter fonticola TaxID=2603215 RepID=UPI0011E70128|nr:YjgN family protein [Marinobacter fonticola]
MTTELYRIQFAGETLEGFETEQVKENLQTLFRISSERVDLFDGTIRTLKTDLSWDEANRYRDHLVKAGADTQVVPIAAPQSVAEPKPAGEAKASPSLSMAPLETNNETGADAASTESQAPPVTPASAAGRPEARRSTAQPVEAGRLRESRVEFTGKGGEYFGIWIVNILLTIATLGIYSAWATVRNNQYFYGNTRLDNASFQYLASPITILKGRLLALAILVVYVVISELFPEAAVALAVGFIFIIPWIVIRSLRFRAVNSAYRNVRFDFEGRYAEALMVTFIWPLLNVFALLLLTPFVVLKTHRFIAHGSRFGTTSFALNMMPGQYYGFFGKGILLGLAFALVAWIAGELFHPVVGLLIMGAGYIAVFGYFMAGVSNLFLNGLSLDGHTFSSELQPGQMIWIYMSNSLLVMLTLGLFTPWAKVRMARYRASRTAMIVDGDLNHFVAAEDKRASALGQEMGDAFDVGLAAF